MSALDRPTGSLRDICIALFRRWEPEHTFVILTSYFDESGTHDGSPAAVMSGIMGTASQWLGVQYAIAKVKMRYGFKVFHAKTFKAVGGLICRWSDENVEDSLYRDGKGHRWRNVSGQLFAHLDLKHEVKIPAGALLPALAAVSDNLS